MINKYIDGLAEAVAIAYYYDKSIFGETDEQPIN